MRAAGQTHQGHVRSHNEDALAFSEDLGLLVIADGLGGHGAGDVASKIAVETVLRLFEEKEVTRDLAGLTRAIHAADQTIQELSLQGLGTAQMRTTIVCALMTETDLLYAWVGDSRIYLGSRDHSLICLSQDHNLYEQKKQQGIKSEPQDKHLLTRSIGGGFEAAIAYGHQSRDEANIERLLLSTDGLHGVVTHREMGNLLFAEADLAPVCDQLIRAALRQGGPDNITVIVADLCSN